MSSRRNATKSPVTRHKAIAPASEPPTPPKDPHGAVVIVLHDGVYNNPRHKTLGFCKRGARIEVAAGPYADSLVADGFVALPGAEPVAEAVETEE
jgi:hypothetical protein